MWLDFWLSDNLIAVLRENGYYSLAQVADADSTTVWRQKWKSDEMISLRGEEVEQWECSLSKLRIILDELLWSMNALEGVYTSKLGHRALCEGAVVKDLGWWWKQLWKYKCPLKVRISMLLSLNNKVLGIIYRKEIRMGQAGAVCARMMMNVLFIYLFLVPILNRFGKLLNRILV